MQTKRYHIIIDVENVSVEVLNDSEGLKQFLNNLPGVIEMHALSEPKVVSGIPENPGLSGFVFIDYSHISVHTFTKTSEALVDIFSCKSYDRQPAIEAILKYFNAQNDQASVQVVSWG